MASVNQCNFIGNIGKIETRYLADGTAVTNLSLAVNEKYKDKTGQIVESVEWVNCSLFSKLAEIAEKYCQKGDPLYVSGRMKTRKWQDKEGNDRYSTEIKVSEMQMLGSKGDRPSNDGGQTPHGDSNEHPAQQSAPTKSDDLDNDEIPF